MSISRLTRMLLLAFLVTTLPHEVLAAGESVRITIGSKSFTESVILGDMLSHLAQRAGIEASHQRQLGGTRVLWNALLSGEIDAYPEYTGTLMKETLVKENLQTEVQLKQTLAALGLRMTRPLGFNNSYAIGMKETLAARLKLRKISDLRAIDPNDRCPYHIYLKQKAFTYQPKHNSPTYFFDISGR